MTSFAKFGSDKPLESHFCVQPRKTTFKHVFRPNAHFFDPGEIDLKQKVFLLHPTMHGQHVYKRPHLAKSQQRLKKIKSVLLALNDDS